MSYDRRARELQVESLVRQALSDRSPLVRALRRRIAPGQAPLSTLKAHGLPALEGGTGGGSGRSSEEDDGEVLVVAQVWIIGVRLLDMFESFSANLA